jgi:hypothetical protein
LQSDIEAAFKRSGATPAQPGAEIATSDARFDLYLEEYSKEIYGEIYEVHSENLALQQENFHLRNELTAARATAEDVQR